MFGAVVSPVEVAQGPVEAELALGVAAAEPVETHVHGLGLLGDDGLVGDSAMMGATLGGGWTSQRRATGRAVTGVGRTGGAPHHEAAAELGQGSASG